MYMFASFLRLTPSIQRRYDAKCYQQCPNTVSSKRYQLGQQRLKTNLLLHVHLLVVVLVLAGDDRRPPLVVVEVSRDRLFDAVGKLRLRQPAQLVVDLRRVDGVAHVVALAVSDVGRLNAFWVEVFEFFRHFIDLVFGNEQRFFIDDNHTFTHSLAIQVKLPSQFGKVEIHRRKKSPEC